MKSNKISVSTRYAAYFILFMIGWNFSSCSTQDDTNNSNDSITIDVTVLGRNNNAIVQTNIDDGEQVFDYDLTESIGINPNSQLMALNNYENTFGYFYSPPFDNSYIVWEKNIATDVGLSYSGFCNETSIETPYFPQVSDDYITVFTAELISTGNRMLNLRIFNKSLGICSKTPIGIADEFQLLTRLIVGNKILTYHFNDQDQAIITKIALETGAIEGQLTFDNLGAATVAGNNLYFYPSSGAVSQIAYDLTTFQFVESLNFSVRPIVATGLFKTESKDGSILIDRNYVQPAEFSTFPALLDQSSGEVTMLADLSNISFNLGSYLQSDLALQMSHDYAVDLDKNIIVGSFALFNFDVTIVEYGIYYSDFSGQILTTVPIDFLAQKVVIR